MEFMPISKFDQQIQKALESIIHSDFEKAKMQLGAMETNIKKEFKKSNDHSKLYEIKRVKLIRAGLFNQKLKL